MMNPHYYLMKSKKILRLESDTTFESLPYTVRTKVFDECELIQLDQDQANWRVVLFRDEILELDEYVEWLSTAEASQAEEEWEYELTAN
jgi:hypothetical protein